MEIWKSLTPPGKTAMGLFLDIIEGGYTYSTVVNKVPYGYEEFLSLLRQAWPTVLSGEKTTEEAFTTLNDRFTAALRGE